MGIALAAGDSSLPSPYNDSQPSKFKSPFVHTRLEKWAQRIESLLCIGLYNLHANTWKAANGHSRLPRNHPWWLVINEKFRLPETMESQPIILVFVERRRLTNIFVGEISILRQKCQRPSPRSGRQRKAWGEAQRNPRIDSENKGKPAEWATALSQVRQIVAPFFPTLRALGFLTFLILGFRCAPPQASCSRPLRGLKTPRLRNF